MSTTPAYKITARKYAHHPEFPDSHVTYDVWRWVPDPVHGGHWHYITDRFTKEQAEEIIKARAALPERDETWFYDDEGNEQ